MSELLVNFETFVLNEINMKNYLKYKLLDDNDNAKTPRNVNVYDKSNIKKQSIFIPSEQDTIFWCYYIIKNGDLQYEMLQNRNTITTKQLKINLVSKIRENKQIVKSYKFDSISNIESNLANDNTITIKTFMTLCAIDNINIILVSNKIYYEVLTNDTNVIYIIREIDNSRSKYGKWYGYEIANEELLNNIRDNYYKVETVDKPIKSLSYYKVADLLNIASKLAIETVNKSTGKNKTKNELYETIIQSF